eukprot:scaffold10089_cov110-Isochrysis_galbana.AAC.1
MVGATGGAKGTGAATSSEGRRAPGGGGESKCTMKHPSNKRGIGRKSLGGKGGNPKGGKFPKTQPAAKADDA